METRTLELRLAAGRLILASDAVQGIYHVQDPITRQFMPMVAPSPAHAAAPRKWAFASLRGPLLGAALGAGLIGLVGFANHWWVVKPTAARERAVASLPMASPSARGAVADGITVVDAAWQQPAAQAPAPAAPSSTPQSPGTVPPSLSAPPQRSTASAAPAVAPPAPGKPAAAAPAAPVRPAAESKPAAAPDKKPPTAATEKGRDDSPVVFNELAPARTPVSSDGMAKVAATPVIPMAKASAARGTGSGGVRLVAVKDASTILVGLPGQLVPVQLKPGSRLPNGAAIVSADPARGVVLLDNGTSLALE